jgi:hypothetical protein
MEAQKRARASAVQVCVSVFQTGNVVCSNKGMQEEATRACCLDWRGELLSAGLQKHSLLKPPDFIPAEAMGMELSR